MSKLAHDWDTYATLANHSPEDICKNCIYRVEEHSWSINSDAKPEKIRQLCTRRGTFNEVCEVCLTGFCKYFTPKLETPLLNPALNIAIEIPKNDFCKVQLSAEGIELSQKVLGLVTDIVKALNDEIKERKQ